MPIITKNSATTNSKYLGCFQAAPMKTVVCRGGMRGVMAKHANTMNGRIMKAIIRMLHPKPTCALFSNFDMMMGNMTPPTDEPETTKPMAAARFLSKYCDTTAKAGNWRKATAEPMRRPWASINW